MNLMTNLTPLTYFTEANAHGVAPELLAQSGANAVPTFEPNVPATVVVWSDLSDQPVYAKFDTRAPATTFVENLHAAGITDAKPVNIQIENTDPNGQAMAVMHQYLRIKLMPE